MLEVDPDTHTGQLWTREHVLAALCDWITLNDGQPPTGPELKRAREAEPGPSHLKTWPPVSAVGRRFGSYPAAIAAAVEAHPQHVQQRAAAFRGHDPSKETTPCRPSPLISAVAPTPTATSPHSAGR